MEPGTLASALMISSVMPSLKYSFSGSALMFASGSTAIAFGAEPLHFRRRVTARFSRAKNCAQCIGELGAGAIPVAGDRASAR